MLLAIKGYLQSRQSANLKDMSLYFKQSPENMRSMLRHWLVKGKVVKEARPPQCGSRCQLCKPDVAEIYRWQG